MGIKITVSGRKFIINYDGHSVVTITQNDDGDFDHALQIIDSMLSNFHQSSPGSIWGCDGVGYVIEKQRGKAFRNKSGVGKHSFAHGLQPFLMMRYSDVSSICKRR